MDILDFGKYNFYIWASYGLTFLILVWNVVIPVLEKKKLKIGRASCRERV